MWISKKWIFCFDRQQCGKMRLFKLLLPTVKYYLNLQYFWLWEDAWWRNERSIINFIQKIMNHILHLSALLRSVWWEVWVLQEGKFFFNVTTQFVNCKKMTQFFSSTLVIACMKPGMMLRTTSQNHRVWKLLKNVS